MSMQTNELQLLFNELKTRLPISVDINKTNMWHKASKKFYDVAHTTEILDYVSKSYTTSWSIRRIRIRSM